VDIPRTARADLAGIIRLRHRLIAGRLPLAELRARIGRHPLAVPTPGALGQLAAFAVIGALSTLAYVLLFVVLHGLGSAQMANLGALLTTAVANTAANRRLTFGVRGRTGAGRAQAQGLLLFTVGLGLTSGSLGLLHTLAARPSRLVEVAVLLAASIAATLVRFALFRAWVFRSERTPESGPQWAAVRPAVTTVPT
jgi:putative flippase GtrA